MQTIAVSWMVLKLTGSAMALGTLLTAQFLPMTLLTFGGGEIADRFPKRSVLFATQLAMCLQSFLLFALGAVGQLHLWHLYGLSAILGIAQALDNPTRQSFVPELVPKEDLPNAFALNSAAFNAAKLVGPALGGLALARFGAHGCFFLNSLSFLAVLFSLWIIKAGRTKVLSERRSASALKNIADGLRFSVTDPRITPIMLMAAVLGVFAYNFNAIAPLIAEFVLHASASGFGYVTAIAGGGSLVAALLVATVGKGQRAVITASAICLSVTMALFATASTWFSNSLLLFLYGFSCISFFTTANTRLQLDTPQDMRGRISGVYVFWITGSTPVGSLLIGWLASRAGVHTAMAVLGGLCLAGTCAALWLGRRVASSAALEHPSSGS
jgi:MFS family permease